MRGGAAGGAGSRVSPPRLAGRARNRSTTPDEEDSASFHETYEREMVRRRRGQLTAPLCTALPHTAHHFNIPHYISQQFTTLLCTTPHFTTLHCTEPLHHIRHLRTMLPHSKYPHITLPDITVLHITLPLIAILHIAFPHISLLHITLPHISLLHIALPHTTHPH